MLRTLARSLLPASLIFGAGCTALLGDFSVAGDGGVDAGPDTAAGEDSGPDTTGDDQVTVAPEAGPETATPEAAAPTNVPVEIVCGGDEEDVNTHHACARYADGRVFCWGFNTTGQLGVDPSTTPMGYSSKPVQVMGLQNVERLRLGSDHTCALESGGALLCWGNDGQGALGVPSAEAGVASPTPLHVPLPGLVNDMALGDAFTCAALKSGSTYCWGNNISGIYGAGKQGGSSATPTQVPTSSLLLRVAAGPYGVCGLDSGGNVFCWGEGGQGILGRGSPGSNTTFYTPAATVNFGTAIDLQPSVVGSCAMASPALTTDGVYCWGGNSIAQIGNAAPSPGEADSPKPIPEFAKSKGVVAFSSKYYNTCALFSDGTVKCVGANQFGSVGSAYAKNAMGNTTPAAVSNLSDATAISVGASFACALRAHGGPGDGASAVCWGANQSGQLGNGTTTDSDVPVTVLLPP